MSGCLKKILPDRGKNMSEEAGTDDNIGPADQDQVNDLLRLNEGKEEPEEETEDKKEEKSEEAPKDESEKSEDTPKKESKETPKEDSDALIDDVVGDALKREDEEEAKELESNIEFSDDSILSDEVREGFIKLDNSADIDDEIVNKMGGLLEMATQDGHDYVIETLKEQRKARRDAMYSNPLLNEKNREQTAKNIEEAVKRFGGDEQDNLMKFFNSHHSYDPHLVSFLNRIGAAVSEKPELGGASKTAKAKTTAEDKLEAEMRKENGILFQD